MTTKEKMLYIQARKFGADRWRLYFRGTKNEVFPGEVFRTSAAARNTIAAFLTKHGEWPV